MSTKQHKIVMGLRNIISRLKKAGHVKLAFRPNPAFYNVSCKEFNKAMTLDQAKPETGCRGLEA